MAPRGRPRKVGLKRMDAAVDNLSPMGFSPDLIRKKVKDLLHVYGGDEAWPVIEEASYRLLIETLLEDVEEHVTKDSKEGTRAEGCLVAEQSECEPSCTANEPLCFDYLDALLSPVTVTEPARLPPATTRNTTAAEANQIQDIYAKEDIAALMDACSHSAPPGFEHLLQGFARRKRKPCLGWIGPKDDDDFVLLKPYPVHGNEKRRSRKSRWDVRAEDFDAQMLKI